MRLELFRSEEEGQVGLYAEGEMTEFKDGMASERANEWVASLIQRFMRSNKEGSVMIMVRNLGGE